MFDIDIKKTCEELLLNEVNYRSKKPGLCKCIFSK